MSEHDEHVDPHLGDRTADAPDELGVTREDAGPRTAGREREPTRSAGTDEGYGPAVTPDEEAPGPPV